MCGVCAILLGDSRAETAAVDLHESLYLLQHRGQDAAGIAVCKGGRVFQAKGNGMVQKNFGDQGERILDLPGFMGIGHLRYPTAGSSSAPFGLSMGVNGNLINAEELRRFLDLEARRHVNTDSDSELLLNILAHALNEQRKYRVDVEDVFTALRDVYSKCKGGFACTGMIAGFGIMGFRDANGIRPLCVGSRPSATLEGATDYFMASESIALRQLGFSNIFDVKPGQAVFVQKGGQLQTRQIVERKSYTPDARQNMGAKLAKKMRDTLGEKGIEEIDVVIPIPETGNTAAAVLAADLRKPLSNAFVKSRYIFRSFILPGQAARKKAVRRKLSPIESEFRGKVVCLLDDSLVRGTTSREIVQMARESGATKVLYVSASPAVTHAHIYGIDLADPTELIAHNKTSEEIAAHIGADVLIYQDLDDLNAACFEAADGRPTEVDGFENGVFSGCYQTEVPEGYFQHLSDLRGKGDRSGSLVASGGAVNVAALADVNDPERRDDISLHNFANHA